MHFAILAVLGVIAIWWFTRSRELFQISVRTGRLLVVRGRVPAGLLGSFRDVLRNTKMSGAIIALKQEHGGRLVCRGGIDSGTEQRLRNVFALYPASKLRHAPLIDKPTLGQLSGIAWLAWLFEDAVRRR